MKNCECKHANQGTRVSASHSSCQRSGLAHQAEKVRVLVAGEVVLKRIDQGVRGLENQNGLVIGHVHSLDLPANIARCASDHRALLQSLKNLPP